MESMSRLSQPKLRLSVCGDGKTNATVGVWAGTILLFLFF